MSNRLIIECEELYLHDLEDIATFLKDLVYLYDRLALLAPYNLENFKEFEDIYTSDYFYRRFSRPLPETDKLKVAHIRLHSPLSIELVLGIAMGFPAAAKAFVELIKIIRDWGYDREMKQLELMKLKLEIAEKIKKFEKELGITNVDEISPKLSKEKIVELIEKDVIRLTRHEAMIKEVHVKDSNER